MAGEATTSSRPGAATLLTGDDKYIEDNYPFLKYLMDRPAISRLAEWTYTTT